MSLPYVCSACRLAPRARSGRHAATRAISSTSAINRKEAAPRQLYLYRAAARDGSNHRNEATRGASSIRGRYSGRELRPEQLLTQLDQPQRPSQQRQASRDRPNRKPAGQRYDEPFDVPLKVQELRNDLYTCSTALDFPATWKVLQELAEAYHDRSPRQRGSFMNLGNVGKTVFILLHRSVDALAKRVRNGHGNPDMPTPYQVLLLLHNAYVVQAIYYRPILWLLAERLWDLHAEQMVGRTIDLEALNQGVDELMSIWRLCIGGNLAHKSFGQDSRDAKVRAFESVANLQDDWSFLPSSTVFSAWQDRRSDVMVEEMLTLLMPPARQAGDASKSTDPARSDYTSAALLTLDLLRSLPSTSEAGGSTTLAMLPRYAPFVNFLQSVLAMAPAPRIPPLLQAKLAETHEAALWNQTKDILSRIGCDVEANAPSQRERKVQQTSGSKRDEILRDEDTELADPAASSQLTKDADAPLYGPSETDRFVKKQIDRLVKTMQSHNVARLPHIIRDIFGHIQQHEDGAPLPLDLFEHMLLTSLSLRDTKTAVEIWQRMTELGIKPTVKTYTVMMRGAQNARDVQGMEAFFHRMRQAGLKPDAYSWTIRIFGLLKLRSVKNGMQALSELGQEWFMAARAKAESEGATKKQLDSNKNITAELLQKYPGAIDGVPRPNLEIMNAAISGLAAVRPEEVPKVFSWGRSFGIEPDLATFNALISVSMKAKRAEDAIGVLRQMQQRGIQADTTTWTVLLNSLFEGGFLENLSPAAQQSKVTDFIDALTDESNGLPGIDSMGYALIIDRLLKQYQNDAAAAAVFAHMLSHGHKPTAHIYTILMTSYFDRQPQPDFSAIENLWRQIQDPTGKGFMPATSVDHVFFDRMIEGYARNHHLVGIRPMESFLAKARESGKQKTGWKALESVARVYAERQLWSKLRTLIDEARIAMRDQSGRMSKKGEREFWDFVHETAILREEGYASREDFQRDRPVGSPLLRAEEEWRRKRSGRS
ncbi:Putative tetratricopeptide-like helical domain superfamily [Septoria linicola]|uniref:Tetratricopeptide-like helical domain superfamily n=1 Tax=Septoria linicola TaxID=215465 RepID=A0A9Q9ASP0_9PEZI|nr:Putative tetratricopeptide-like helical domain superfamily [Septoria linicola]